MHAAASNQIDNLGEREQAPHWWGRKIVTDRLNVVYSVGFHGNYIQQRRTHVNCTTLIVLRFGISCRTVLGEIPRNTTHVTCVFRIYILPYLCAMQYISTLHIIMTEGSRTNWAGQKGWNVRINVTGTCAEERESRCRIARQRIMNVLDSTCFMFSRGSV